MELRIGILNSPEVRDALLDGRDRVDEELAPGVRFLATRYGDGDSTDDHFAPEVLTGHVLVPMVVAFLSFPASLAASLVGEYIWSKLKPVKDATIYIEKTLVEFGDNGEVTRIVTEKRREER